MNQSLRDCSIAGSCIILVKGREPEEGFEQYSVSSVSSCSIAFIDLCAAKEPSRHSRERGNDKQNLLGGSICCSSQ
jgi:hypothetical protein